MVFDMDGRLRAWAARKLSISRDQIASVETETWGLCGNGTCEFSGASIEVTLTDGRVFEGEGEFGLFLRDIVEMDLDDEGRVVPSLGAQDLFDLAERV